MSAFGIDLGTTNSVLSVLSEKKPHTPLIISSPNNRKTTPSVVNYDGEKITVGDEAVKKLENDRLNTVFSIKSLMGRKYDPNLKLPYKTVPHSNGDVMVELKGRKFSPEEISSKIIKTLFSKLKKKNSTKIDSKNLTCVLAVPARFNERQRRASITAARLAGLKIDRVINEPTAAALAYGISTKKDGIFAVYDFGGGTFDISILEVRDGIFEVLSTAGDLNLGGDLIDGKISEYLNISKHKSEEFKKELTYKETIKLNDKKSVFSRENLENLAKPIIDRTLKISQKALDDACVNKEEIDGILLVGGMTRMPAVRKATENFYGKNPESHVNPDEAVAKGAALQAGIIKGIIDDSVLLDITSLSLGIETNGGIFSRILNRNRPLPAKAKETFTTSEDDQESVSIKIFQGEEPLVSKNSFLGEFKLENISKNKKGVPRIDVEFEADTCGMVKVKAVDRISGERKSINIRPSGGLTEEEIESIKI